MERVIHSQHVIADDVREFPNDKSAVGSHARQSVSVHGHVAHCHGAWEQRWQLQESAISTGPRDNTHATYNTTVSMYTLPMFSSPSPLVIAYATQCVAPIVLPGRNVESTLTSAIAVDLTKSRGAWISSSGWETSKKIVCGCALTEIRDRTIRRCTA